ncbi:acyltransferase family protein [Frigoribacterium sp. PvP032]|uniref:acyltransferase family protein n=1 Tax=Frigoribacterium sp. PvP032 TaxID=2806589 RepID=UPI001AE321C6|nr:acyltransferase family protein [Frigoribacterium sp. PvP032]MBP1189391.1 peptidoglycan/LPS O-acetylase OafA/YrhL [Frigoribacterium sp. PvP032]
MTTTQRTAFRPDVEGLRAIAVLVVVAEHLVGWPAGGFVGVDVFFVVSGFVITAVLLAELDAAGSVSLTAFYARRARRVLPAAGVVVGVVVVAAWVLWLAPRAWATVLDAVAAALFVENWHLVALGTDYLAADGAVSPLQHFWSLAVEEQFYLVWPLLVIAVALAVRVLRRPGAARALLAVVFSGVLLGSAVWSAWRTDVAPSAAYFDSVGRAWELAAGGLAALAVPVARRVPVTVRRALTLVGQLVIVGSALFVGSALASGSEAAGAVTAFPWPWALLPVLGTVLVVTAGSGTLGRVEAVLVSRPARWVGRRSYSLYLWHFPVIVFAASFGLDGPAWVVAQLALTLALTVASYRLVEQRVQRSGWLRRAAHPAPASAPASDSGRRGAGGPVAQAALAVLVGVVVIGTSAAQLRGPAWLVDPAAAREVSSAGAPGSAGAPEAPGSHGSLGDGPVSWDAASLRAALDAAVSGSGDVPVDVLDEAFSSSSVPQIGPGGCRYDVGTAPDLLEPCLAGPASAEHVAVVVGDSIALSWMPAVVEALGPGWRVLGLGIGSCSTVDARFHGGDGRTAFADECARSRSHLAELVERTAPDLVVTSSSAAGVERLLSGADGAEAAAEWRRGTTSAVARLSRAGDGARVVVLGAPPRGASPADCATRATRAGLCSTQVEPRSIAAAAAEAAGVADALTAGVDADWVDVTDWFTSADGLVPVTAGPLLVRSDAQHLTTEMSRSLAGLVRPHLVPGAAAGG